MIIKTFFLTPYDQIDGQSVKRNLTYPLSLPSMVLRSGYANIYAENFGATQCLGRFTPSGFALAFLVVFIPWDLCFALAS